MAVSQADSPSHDYLTVRELADLLRLKERKVYDLAASGKVPCSRATGKLLFPAKDVHQWIASAQSGAFGSHPMDAPRPPIVVGSHDPLLDWAIRQSGSGLATYYDGSSDGLDRFLAGEGIAAALHLRDTVTGLWNQPQVARRAAGCNAVLVGFARRRRGFVTVQGTPMPSTFDGLKGRAVVPRQPGSGTDVLFWDLAAAAGLAKQDLQLCDIARTEDDAAEAVRRGDAEIAFGLEAVAQSYGLGFQPVIEEEFALLFDRKAWFEAPVQGFMAFCESDAFRQRARGVRGYDLSILGQIQWNA